jgi:uncharacterized protein (TIGR00251 family)
MANFIRLSGDVILADIKVVPGASKNGIAGIQGDRLRIRVAAAPEDGKANAELISFFAKMLACPKKEIALVSGDKSRLKTLSFPIRCKEMLEKCAEESR